MSNRTVFLRNLSFDSTEETIREYFKDCGKISSLRIPLHRETGKPRGFAFIEFEDDESVQNALQRSEITINDRVVYVVLSTQTVFTGVISEAYDPSTTIAIRGRAQNRVVGTRDSGRGRGTFRGRGIIRGRGGRGGRGTIHMNWGDEM
jgi:RNA recognition motif-containing protein